MARFSKFFITNRGAYTFHFFKIEGVDLAKYFVSVEDGSLRIASFDMKQNQHGVWKVIAPAPDFVLQEEQRLAAVIEGNSRRA